MSPILCITHNTEYNKVSQYLIITAGTGSDSCSGVTHSHSSVTQPFVILSCEGSFIICLYATFKLLSRTRVAFWSSCQCHNHLKMDNSSKKLMISPYLYHSPGYYIEWRGDIEYYTNPGSTFNLELLYCILELRGSVRNTISAGEECQTNLYRWWWWW